MLLPAAITLPLLVSLSLSLSQQTFQARPVPGPVQDAGVYHIATGTGTRDRARENLGSKVLHSNLASTGFFGVMGVGCDIVWTDERRIPSKSGHPNADADSYLVDGFQLGYCPRVPGPTQRGATFYECYASCTDPLALPRLETLHFTAPGVVPCWWIVTFALDGPSHEFTIGGDCEGRFDAPADLSGEGTSAAVGDIVLASRPVPAQGGIFFHAANKVQTPFGDGFLCANGDITRGTIVLGGTTGCGAQCSSYVYDKSDAEHAFGPFVGATRNFQHWCRDPMGAGTCFDTSNVVSATIPP